MSEVVMTTHEVTATVTVEFEGPEGGPLGASVEDSQAMEAAVKSALEDAEFSELEDWTVEDWTVSL